MLGTVRGDAVLPVWTGAFAARDLRRIGQLRRKAEAFGDFRGAEEIDLGVREPAPALGAVPDGVRADAGKMPVDGVVFGIQEEVPVQEQAGESGREHDRSVPVDVRLGEVPADKGSREAASAAGPRRLSAQL